MKNPRVGSQERLDDLGIAHIPDDHVELREVRHRG
jgi:hypothetical protein